jgi:crotonobetainyl-CoA:carnitine CoA-transferase CaiB-like acyl-CoA transferase
VSESILGGLKVVDLSWGLAGPVTALILAGLGFENDRIEEFAKQGVIKTSAAAAADRSIHRQKA